MLWEDKNMGKIWSLVICDTIPVEIGLEKGYFHYVRTRNATVLNS